MWIGILGAFISAMEAAGTSLADRVKGISLTRLLLLMGGASLLLALTFPLGGSAVPILIGGYFTIFGMSSTLFGAQPQKAITGPARTTVTSVASFGENLGAIMGFMAFGAVAQFYGMNGGTLATGITALILALAFIWLGKRLNITR